MQLKFVTFLTGARSVLAVGALSMAFATAVNAAEYTLNDGYSTAKIDADGGAGMYSWIVGNQEQLNQQWFYYRIGNSGYAAPINSISTASLLGGSANSLALNYANSEVSLTITYVLTGLGVSSADIQESISIENLSGCDLDLHFFQYSDFNLLGTAQNDTVEFLGRDSVRQTELSFGIQEAIISPSSSRFETRLAGAGGTLDKLLHKKGYNLNDKGGPLTGDVTWAFQWDFVIEAGQSVEILKDKTLVTPVVPEPTTTALTLLGPAAIVASWRRKSGN